MGLSYLPILLFTFSVYDACVGVRFLLTCPKEPAYDADIVATVTAFDLSPRQTETVTLTYRGMRDTSRIINSTTLSFNSDGLKVWSVMFTWDRMRKIDETGVQLTMSSGQHEDKMFLSFTPNFGYIFIQTDKPVYTPLQSVKYRVIAVDEYQRLAKYIIKIDIKNPKQIVVDRTKYTAEEAFKAKEFMLPKDTLPGEWSISANFERVDHTSGHIHTVRFQVKEYVLPRFSNVIQVKPDVITNDTQWVTINITSRYVYGRPLIGGVEVKLGILDTNRLMMLSNTYSESINGSFVKAIRVSHVFPKTLDFTIKKRLYVKAKVTESTSLESHVTEDISTFICDPYYLVDFKMSKRYFKPGFPYTLHVQVSAQSGKPASRKRVYVQSTFFNRENQRIREEKGDYELSDDGELMKDLAVPMEANQINFYVVVIDPQNAQINNHSYTVEKYSTPNNQYLHISISTPIKRNQPGIILLQYTKPGQPVAGTKHKPEIITVLVLAKGQIIYTTTSTRNLEGHSSVQLPAHLYAETSPSMRIVAYFYFKSSQFPEEIIDSLFVNTPDVCFEELHLTPPSGVPDAGKEYKPKDRYILKVDGGPHMNVGFLAVDTAVYLVNNKQSLTRPMMFSQFGSHDQGVGIGDGSYEGEVLEKSGLQYLRIDLSKAVDPNDALLQGNLLNEVIVQFWGISEPLLVEAGSNPNVEGVVGRNMGNRRPQERVMTNQSPPENTRIYFPESWFFEERKLPKSGQLDVNLTLPDTITTWSFLAVGISSAQGICVSHPVEQSVQKPFFTDVSLPYKVTRLEEVKIKISVYNYLTYNVQVGVVVTGSEGLCFSANAYRGSTKNSSIFTMTIEAGQSKSEKVKVIPLKIGDLVVRANLTSQRETDVVEKKLHVVAEGQRKSKSITFVLDPEAKHATFCASKQNKTALYESTTVNNVFDLKNKEQKTTIDLALPSNVIRGTESCKISAFGDLMGDIITYAVVESKNLLDTPLSGAEEILGNLAPTLYALISTNKFNLLGDNLRATGNTFVKTGIMRLLTYTLPDYSFHLTQKSKKPSTWLTAFVLKTLCHASTMVFIDRDKVIDEGFVWLFDQVKKDGTLHEQDPRKSYSESVIMLSAEVLITIMECKQLVINTMLKATDERELVSQTLSKYLQTTVGQIKDPMVLAKVTYALMLFDHTSNEHHESVMRLLSMKRKNKHGHFYWSKVEETNEDKRIPHWYHNDPHASAIEATAYALLVFVENGGANIDAIADWLVGQRNHNGAFIGVMDTSSAIQALSEYSYQKHAEEVDLHCNISSDRLKGYSHSFTFTAQNAIHRESLHNVPVGQVLDVLTHGYGLGQMQVNVEYNIPIDKNQYCPFQIKVNVSNTQFIWREDQSNPLCFSCGIGCPKLANTGSPIGTDLQNLNATPSGKSVAAKMTIKVGPGRKGKGKTGNSRRPPNRGQRLQHPRPQTPRQQNSRRQTPRPQTPRSQTQRSQTQRSQTPRSQTPRPRSGGRRSVQKQENVSRNNRYLRAVNDNLVSSRKSICIHVCLQHKLQGLSEPVEVRIEMLTGYQPMMSDIDQIRALPHVIHAEYDKIRDIVVVQFTEISCVEETCVAFRAVDVEEAGRLTPANVEVIQIGTAATQCVMQYESLPHDSLQVYCANFSNTNRGECRCYSGICSMCKPAVGDDLALDDVKQMACKAPIAYQLQIANITNMDHWVEISSTVISVNKTGTDNLTSGSIIKLMTPASCMCPLNQYKNTNEKFYLLSADVEKLVDSTGNTVYQYLLDEQSTFLRVANEGSPASKFSVPHYYLKISLPPNKCNL